VKVTTRIRMVRAVPTIAMLAATGAFTVPAHIVPPRAGSSAHAVVVAESDPPIIGGKPPKKPNAL